MELARHRPAGGNGSGSPKLFLPFSTARGAPSLCQDPQRMLPAHGGPRCSVPAAGTAEHRQHHAARRWGRRLLQPPSCSVGSSKGHQQGFAALAPITWEQDVLTPRGEPVPPKTAPLSGSQSHPWGIASSQMEKERDEAKCHQAGVCRNVPAGHTRACKPLLGCFCANPCWDACSAQRATATGTPQLPKCTNPAAIQLCPTLLIVK